MTKMVQSKRKKLAPTNLPMGLVGLIFGTPGAGKTSLLSTIRKPFFIGNENNNGFKFNKFLPCQTWKEFRENLNYCLDYEPETIVVDNLSSMQKKLLADFVPKGVKPEDVPFGRAFAELGYRFESFMENIEKVIHKNINVIFIAHHDINKKFEELKEKRKGSEVFLFNPRLHERVYSPLSARADFIFNIHAHINEGRTQRVLLTQATDLTLAKKKHFIEIDDELYLKEYPNGEKLSLDSKNSIIQQVLDQRFKQNGGDQ